MGELFQARALRALMGSAAAVACVAFAVPAMAQTRSFDVSAQSAAKGIPAFARQAGIQLLAPAREMRGKRTNAVKGSYPVEQALRMLLQGTGLEASRDPGTGITTIRAAAQAQTTSSRGRSDATRTASAAGKASPGTGEARTASSSGEELADVESEEIIVTAQKREERLLDVPVPITAISGRLLTDSGLARVQDFYERIPGLTLTPSIQSAQNLSLRGISTGFANPTVGVTVDDVPFGSPLGLTGGLQVPDIDPSDLQRVEVLRGPQGALYGASSMGGLLKFVTIDPDPKQFEGRVQAGLSGVTNGNRVGYNLRGAFNVPLADGLAIRASGFTRRDPGYYDNVQTGEEGVNEAIYHGVRGSLMWAPLDNLTVKLSAMFQRAEGDGAAEADRLPGLGRLQQSRLAGTGWFNREIQAYSAHVNADLGAIALTSVSAFTSNNINDTFDYTYALGGLTQGQFGVRGTPLLNRFRNKRFTQELRGAVELTQGIDLLLGGFYASERSKFGQSVLAANETTGTVIGTYFSFYRPYRYSEIAGFANLTLALSDRFDVQLGGRYSRFKQSNGPTPVTGFPPFLNTPSNTALTPEVRGVPDDVFTYLVTPRWRPSEDVMIYARFASGFRPGFGGSSSPNDQCVVFSYPCQYGPDQTQNYEIGAKGKLLGGAVGFDVSLYQVTWKDIQIQAFNPGAGATYTTNGSEARSRGFEFAFDFRPWKGMTISPAGSIADAELTKALPAGAASLPNGAAGDQLPLSTQFTATLSIDQRIDISSDVTGKVGATISHIGSRQGPFVSRAEAATSVARGYYPAYTKIDLRAGIDFGALGLDVFINNVGDERGTLSGGPGFFPPYSVTYIQPRTAGFSLSYAF